VAKMWSSHSKTFEHILPSLQSHSSIVGGPKSLSTTPWALLSVRQLVSRYRHRGMGRYSVACRLS